MPPATPQPNTSRRSISKSGKPDNEGNPDMSLTGIGNYIFEKTIGQGNFAKVKLARHKLTNREVAIKIIDKTTMDEKKLSKLHREVRIMKMLNHPNIVKLFEVIETKYTLFLVMEYVNGGELYDYLVTHGRMKEKDARAKFRQIVSAVQYCHKKRVIHRDLKAENLLLDDALNVKIADFGFGNNYAPEGQLDTFCGSPPYAAPELFQGQKYTGPEVDIWSLGVILYVLVTGCLPFDGKDLKEMREVVCRGRYKVPFYLSEPCEKLLRKFLVRDPTKRQSLDMLKEDPWLNEGYDSPCVMDTVAPDVLQKIDDDVVAYMCEKFNLHASNVQKCLKGNEYDDISAIYFLLVDQKLSGKWAGVPSLPGTISPTSGNFSPSIPSPLAKPVAMLPIDENGTGHQAAPGAIPNTGTPSHQQMDPADNSSPQVTFRERSKTVSAASGQRPVTWATNDGPVVTGADQPIPEMPSSPSSKGKPVNTNRFSVVDPGANSETSSNSPTPQNPQTSKSGNNVISIIRSLSNRFSDNPAKNQSAQQQQPNAAISDEKPRTLRFTFNSNTTSSKPPLEIVREIETLLKRLGISYRMNGRYLVECTWNFRDWPMTKVEESCNASQQATHGNLGVEQLQRALAEVMSGSDSNSNMRPSTPTSQQQQQQYDTNNCVMFDIEVCELPRLKNLHGLRFRRSGGPSAEYKDICAKILSLINL